MSTALQQINKFEQAFLVAKDKLSNILDKSISVDKFIGSVLVTVAKDTKLQACTPESILESCYDAASLGLAIDARNLAYLVPYGNKAKLMPSYKGMVELALKSGVVTNIFAEVVFSNDRFKYEAGTIQTIEHIPVAMNKPRGNFIGAYAVARFANGLIQPCVMRLDEINKVKNKSRSSGSGPWVSDFEEMAKKTVVRRLFKLLPSNVIPVDAYRVDDDHFDFSKPTTGEHEKVNAEETTDSTEVEETKPVQSTSEAKKTSPTAEDYKNQTINKIFTLVSYNAVLNNLAPGTIQDLQAKYKDKSLDAVDKIAQTLEQKVKPTILLHLYRSHQSEEEVGSPVPANQYLESSTDQDAMRFTASELWNMYVDSKQRLHRFLEQAQADDNKNVALSYEENKSLGR